MSKRTGIVLLLLLVTAAGLGWLGGEWLPADPGGAVAARPGESSFEATGPLSPTGAEAAGEGGGAASVGRRSVVTAVGEAQPAGTVWVEGRVVFPPDTPAEQVFVFTANADSPEHPRHEAPVAEDGSFRVALPRNRAESRLDLRSLYLYLERPLVLTPSEEMPPVTLAPRLGGCIRVTLRPPSGASADARSLVGKRARLSPRALPGRAREPRIARSHYRAHVGADLRLLFRALPCGAAYKLTLKPERFPDVQRADIRVRAGEDTLLELPLKTGVRLAGRVVDEDGEPLKTVRVSAWSLRGAEWLLERRDWSQRDGSFLLAGLTPGTIQIGTDEKGHPPTRRRLGALPAGAAREALELVLSQGESLSGLVLWPDGSPVENGRIRVRSEGPGAVVHNGRMDALGGFELSSLPHGFCSLAVQAQTGPRLEHASGAGWRPSRSQTWSAYRERVPTGTRGLILTLRQGITVTGRVVDELGAPVARYQLYLEPGHEPYVSAPPFLQKIRHYSRAADGRFVVENVYPWTWHVFATTEDSVTGTRRLVLPGQETDVTLVLPGETP